MVEQVLPFVEPGILSTILLLGGLFLLLGGVPFLLEN